MSKPLSPDLKLAEKFLQFIDSNSDQHTFQTFDDNADRKDKSLNRIFNGTIHDYFNQLVELNLRGAGAYFTVQGTDVNTIDRERVFYTGKINNRYYTHRLYPILLSG